MIVVNAQSSLLSRSVTLSSLRVSHPVVVFSGSPGVYTVVIIVSSFSYRRPVIRVVAAVSVLDSAIALPRVVVTIASHRRPNCPASGVILVVLATAVVAVASSLVRRYAVVLPIGIVLSSTIIIAVD
jgi:hypothetical protein